MRKNLRSTSFIFSDDTDLDRAWSDMRKTLDEKLPVERNDRTKRTFFYYFKTAAMLLPFLGALLLGKIYFKDYRQGNHLQKRNTLVYTKLHTKDEVIGSTALKSTKSEHLNESAKISKSGASPANVFSNIKNHNRFFLPNKSSNDDNREYSLIPLLTEKMQGRRNKYDNPLISENEMKRSIKGEAKITHNGITGLQKVGLPHRNAMTLKDISITTYDTVKNGEPRSKKRLVGFEIGGYYNIGGSFGAIYPIASMTIPLNKRTFLSLGVGLNSQIKIKGFAPKEFVVLNDTVNQAYFTIEQKSIRKATYIDLPLLFNYKLNKYFTIGAGFQLSILQSIDIRTEKRTFNFQSNLAQEISISPTITTNNFTPYQAYAPEYTVMKTNWRFMAGVGYQFKEAGIKFQYEKSLTPNYSLLDFNGVKSEKRLSVLTVGLTYRIR